MEITLSKALVMRKRTFQKLRKNYDSFSRTVFLPAGTEVNKEHLTGMNAFSKKEEKIMDLYTTLSVKIQQSNVGIATELVELELAKNSQRELQRQLYQVENNNRINAEVRPICLLDVKSVENLLTEVEEKIEKLQDTIAEFNIKTKITIPDELLV